MNIKPVIKTALSGLTYGGKSVPVKPLVYSGPADAYITFYTILEKDAAYADDEPISGETTATLDLFCRGDYVSLLEDIKTRMKAVGFTITGVGPEQYETDDKLYHVPIDVYIEDDTDGEV